LKSFVKEKFGKYQSFDGARYLTGLVHVVSLVFFHACFALCNMSASASFAIDTLIHGYVYKEIWPNPVDEGELTCEHRSRELT